MRTLQAPLLLVSSSSLRLIADAHERALIAEEFSDEALAKQRLVKTNPTLARQLWPELKEQS